VHINNGGFNVMGFKAVNSNGFNKNFRLDMWLVILGGWVLFTQMLLIISAERGRKKDLVKRKYSARHGFYLAVLIPYLRSEELPQLQKLIRALKAQQYPSGRLAIHLVTSPETQADFEFGLMSDSIHHWVYPESILPHETGKATAWLIDRCLASGRHDVMVRLNPTDLIKDNFCDNIANEACNHSVMQGYLANQQAGHTMVDRSVALFQRLRSRIDNAGRHHLGLGAFLLESGWAIKSDVLERIPYRQGLDTEHSEYALRLSLADVKVSWTPSIVVYRDPAVPLMGMVMQQIYSAITRASLLVKYLVPVLAKTGSRPRINCLSLWANLIAPTEFFMGILLLTGAFASVSMSGLLGITSIWLCLMMGSFAFHGLKLSVARCDFKDVVTSVLYTPMVYLMGLSLSPLALLNGAIQGGLNATQGRRNQPRYMSQSHTRLNEDQAPLMTMIDDKNPQGTGEYHLDNITPIYSNKQTETQPPQEQQPTSSAAKLPETSPLLNQLKQAVAHDTVSSVPRFSNTVVEKIIPISNNEREVDATLQLHTSTSSKGQPLYKMVLLYKSVSLATQRYKILDQAFYELQSKIQGRGLTIVTCGSCGYYYHPTVDEHNLSKNTGVCLFGKLGRNVDISTDAVTVISQACNYHAALADRETIVRSWQDSLTTPLDSPTPVN
jgi:hypothetical protein